MRIVQLIDSLEPGGAERMSVNYANMLSETIAFSSLVTTRQEGPLKEELLPGVFYLFLKKKHTLDFRAVFRLRHFIKKHKIALIHAHSSSFFMAVMTKLIYPQVKIIWHDHYGNSNFLEQRKTSVLKWASVFFAGIRLATIIILFPSVPLSIFSTMSTFSSTTKLGRIPI